MDILLIAGLWLDGSAWDDVAPPLESGHWPMFSKPVALARLLATAAAED